MTASLSPKHSPPPTPKWALGRVQGVSCLSQICHGDPCPEFRTGTGTLSPDMRTLCLHPEPSPRGTGTLFPGSRSTAQIPRWRTAALRRQVIPSSTTAWESGIISRQVALNPDERAAGMFHPLPSLRSIPCSASTWDGIGTSIPPRRDVGSPPPTPRPALRPWDEAGPAKGLWDLGHGRRDPRAVDPQVPPQPSPRSRLDPRWQPRRFMESGGEGGPAAV